MTIHTQIVATIIRTSTLFVTTRALKVIMRMEHDSRVTIASKTISELLNIHKRLAMKLKRLLHWHIKHHAIDLVT